MKIYEDITDEDLKEIYSFLHDLDWKKIYFERNSELINMRNRFVMIINRDQETWDRYCSVNDIKYPT